MTFAQALVRIEGTLNEMKTTRGVARDMLKTTLRLTLEEHANDIVQLGKVAERMRSGLYDDERGAYEYDKLMKGDE